MLGPAAPAGQTSAPAAVTTRAATCARRTRCSRAASGSATRCTRAAGRDARAGPAAVHVLRPVGARRPAVRVDRRASRRRRRRVDPARREPASDRRDRRGGAARRRGHPGARPPAAAGAPPPRLDVPRAAARDSCCPSARRRFDGTLEHRRAMTERRSTAGPAWSGTTGASSTPTLDLAVTGSAPRTSGARHVARRRGRPHRAAAVTTRRSGARRDRHDDGGTSASAGSGRRVTVVAEDDHCRAATARRARRSRDRPRRRRTASSTGSTPIGPASCRVVNCSVGRHAGRTSAPAGPVTLSGAVTGRLRAGRR